MLRLIAAGLLSAFAIQANAGLFFDQERVRNCIAMADQYQVLAAEAEHLRDQINAITVQSEERIQLEKQYEDHHNIRIDQAVEYNESCISNDGQDVKFQDSFTVKYMHNSCIDRSDNHFCQSFSSH